MVTYNMKETNYYYYNNSLTYPLSGKYITVNMVVDPCTVRLVLGELTIVEVAIEE